MNIYQQELLDHYHHPKNRGSLNNADFSSGEYNPSCGDRVAMQGTINNGRLTAVVFTGSGCVISQAAASMLCQQLQDKPIKEILSKNADYMISLINIPLGPTRLKCALLALHALQQGIISYQDRKKDA